MVLSDIICSYTSEEQPKKKSIFGRILIYPDHTFEGIGEEAKNPWKYFLYGKLGEDSIEVVKTHPGIKSNLYRGTKNGKDYVGDYSTINSVEETRVGDGLIQLFDPEKIREVTEGEILNLQLEIEFRRDQMNRDNQDLYRQMMTPGEEPKEKINTQN